MFREEIHFVRLFRLDILICRNWFIMFYLEIYFVHKWIGSVHCRVKVEFTPAPPSLHCLYFIYARKYNTWKGKLHHILNWLDPNKAINWGNFLLHCNLTLLLNKFANTSYLEILYWLIFTYFFESVIFEWVLTCSIARTAWVVNFVIKRLIFTHLFSVVTDVHISQKAKYYSL